MRVHVTPTLKRHLNEITLSCFAKNINKTSTLHVHHAFLYISLSFLQDLAFYGERKGLFTWRWGTTGRCRNPRIHLISHFDHVHMIGEVTLQGG